MSPERSMLACTHPDASLTDGVRRWNVAALTRAVTDWHTLLDEMDVRVVAFDLPNGLEWVALDIALLESGRVAVPLPSFFSAAQRAHALSDSGAEALIMCAVDAAPPTQPVEIWRHVRNLALYRIGAATASPLPQGTALVTYTSGSTGAPKGVCLSAATLLETAHSVVDALRDVGVARHLCVLPLTLLLENTAGLFANLINGSEIHVPNLTSIGIRGSSDLDLTEFLKGIEWHAPHSLILVPGLLLGLTAAGEFGLADLSALKFVAVGGGRVAPALLERAATQQLPVFEGYGLTECGSVVAMNTPAAHRPGTVGRLLPHVRANVVNGELQVAHPRLCGVLGEEQADSGVVATGDRVEIDTDGFITIHGRIKNTYITAFGRNVAPEWVESELQSELAIAHAAVFGEGQVTATALLVPRGDVSDVDLQAAVNACNARLPDYARIGAWHRLSPAQLQAADGLTANGRIRRGALERAFKHLIPQSEQGAVTHA